MLSELGFPVPVPPCISLPCRMRQYLLKEILCFASQPVPGPQISNGQPANILTLDLPPYCGAAALCCSCCCAAAATAALQLLLLHCCYCYCCCCRCCCCCVLLQLCCGGGKSLRHAFEGWISQTAKTAHLKLQNATPRPCNGNHIFWYLFEGKIKRNEKQHLKCSFFFMIFTFFQIFIALVKAPIFQVFT